MSELQKFKEQSLHAPTPLPKEVVPYDHDLEFRHERKVTIKSLLNDHEGYIVGRIGDEPLKFQGQGHFITSAPTGSGKGTGAIIPNLLAHSGAAFVIDIKGNTVAATASIKRLQGHKVVVIDPHDVTKGKWGKDSYNPFDPFLEIAHERTSDSKLMRIIRCLMFDPEGGQSKEPIWDNATMILFRGLLTLALRYWPPYRRNLRAIYRVLNSTEEELEAFVKEVEHIRDSTENIKHVEKLRNLLSILKQGRAKTKIPDNALLQANIALSWVINESFDDLTETSTFSFKTMREDKTIVYLVIEEEYVENVPVYVRLMLESIIFSQENTFLSLGTHAANLKQKDRVLVMIDELPVFGKLDVVARGMATVRDRGINLWLFIQHLKQLDDIYGENKSKTILGNAACLQIFGTNELSELKFLVELIGEDFFDIPTVSFSESVAEGESFTETKTRTITNGGSYTHAKGISDQYSETNGKNWSKTFGDTVTLSSGQTKSLGEQKGITQNSSWQNSGSTGKSRNSGTQFKRGLLFSTADNDNTGKAKTKNTSVSMGGGKAANRSTTLNSGQSQSKSKAHQKSKTIGRNKSQTWGTTQTDTITEGRTWSEANAVGTSRGKTKTHTVTRGVSISPKRMSLETVRTVREKLSGQNQVLYIKSAQPFFTPVMSYFATYTDVKHYMFPDMAAMAAFDRFDYICSRDYLLQNLEFGNDALKENSHAVLVRAYVSQIGKPRDQVDYQKACEVFKAMLDNGINEVIEDANDIESALTAQRQGFGEAAIAALGFMRVLKITVPSVFMWEDKELIEKMMAIEALADVPINFGKPLTPFLSLRLLNDDPSLYDTDRVMWIAEQYYPSMKAIMQIVKAEHERLVVIRDEQDKTRIWLNKILKEIRDIRDKVIAIARERDDQKKVEFLNQYGKESI